MESFIVAAICMLITFVLGALFGMLLLIVARYLPQEHREPEAPKKPAHEARKVAKDDE